MPLSIAAAPDSVVQDNVKDSPGLIEVGVAWNMTI
jgi:hypothetical protein